MRHFQDFRITSFGAALVIASGCVDASGPKSGPPAAISAVAGGAQSAPVVGMRLPIPLEVRVTDAQGRPVAGATVTWKTAFGTLASPTSVTDRSGGSKMEWTLGTAAGIQTATASIATADPVAITFSERAVAGPLTQIVLTRDTVRLVAPGDAFRLNVRPADKYGNLVLGGSVVEAADTTVVSVSNFGSGATLVAKVANAMTTLRVTAGALTKLATVIVLPAPCAQASNGLSLGVGEVALLSGAGASEICLQTSSAQEFVAVPFYSDLSGAFLRLALATANISTPAVQSGLSSAGARLVTGASGHRYRRDDAFEEDLRERSRRELTPLMSLARATRQSRGGRFNVSTAAVEVGAVLQLNVNASAGCNNPTMKAARVVAISNRAIVVADTSNPANGFSNADYEFFAATFDTLIYPLDVQTFGEPSDIDGNQKVLLFFTRAVNELTPANQNFYIGGFFYGRDLFPKTKTDTDEACVGSNQAEMFYLLTPDPDGVVNNNKRPVEFVRSVTLGTLAHEFQHIINSSRHLYVNASPVFEDPFLDEGLAHVAEELAFYRATGLAPGQNISGSTIQSSAAIADAFQSFALSNVRRFREYLLNPTTNSPYANNDDLTTRGATWSFLRYVADRRGGAQNEMWFRLVNPTVATDHGLANLSHALGSDLPVLLRDWAVANYADDFVPGLAAQFTHPSWNFRSVLAAVDGDPFPLSSQQIDGAAITSIGIGDGSAAYLSFAIAAGSIGGARVTARGGNPPNGFYLSVLRTR